jgi:hypothetical protein
VAEKNNPSAKTTEKLLDTAARVLAPLVRLLIARGVTFQMASELLKQVYVRVAQKQFVEEDEVTGTKLSLLTGLNRKEIRRLTSKDVEQNIEPITSFASAVHAVWRTQRRWRDKKGNPKILPRRSADRLLSFDDLVRSVTTDHRPSAIFDELMRLKYVEIDDDENVSLKNDSYLATPDFADKVLRLAEGLEDHVAAAVANVLDTNPKFLDRFMYGDELSNNSADALQNLARLEWEKVQEILVNQAIALEDSDASNGEKNTTRIRVGMYFYSEAISVSNIQKVNES